MFSLLEISTQYGCYWVVYCILKICGSSYSLSKSQALTIAIQNERTDIIELLLNNKIYTQDQLSQALVIILEQNKQELAKIFIDRGVRGDAYSLSLDSIIDLCIKRSHIDTLEHIVATKKNKKKYLQHIYQRSMHYKNMTCIEFSIDRKVMGMSALNEAVQCAAADGHVKLLRLLIAKGADIHSQDNFAFKNYCTRTSNPKAKLKMTKELLQHCSEEEYELYFNRDIMLYLFNPRKGAHF